MISNNPGADAIKLTEIHGIQFFQIPSDKFKTTRIDILFAEPLAAENAAANAIVPALLKRGCEAYPTQTALERRLELLYGADFSTAVTKKGESQVLHFSMTHIAERFASGGEPLFCEAGDLLQQILFTPVLQDGTFRQDEFKQELDNLIDEIDSRVNDKIRYALIRCVENMCQGEAFALQPEGNKPEAEALTSERALAAYRRILNEAPCFVYFSGELAESDMLAFAEAFAQKMPGVRRSPVKTMPGKMPESFRVIEEEMDINQAKLCMGFRTAIAGDSADYPALMVYNGILGGDLHSKLFQNVREKASLAYYASSRLERHKQLLFINSGIDIANRTAAEEIILQQVQDMRDGKITDEEFQATIRSIESSLKSVRDSQASIMDYHFSQHLSGSADSFDMVIAKVKQVTPADVVRVAGSVVLDTIYLLKPVQVAEGVQS